MVIELLTTIFGGGVSGLLGTAVTKYFGYLEAKQKQEERKEERKHELSLLDKQAELRAQEAESEQQIAAWDAFAQSYNHDASTGKGSQWVINILRLVRPVLTLILLGLTGLIYFNLDDTELQGVIVHGVVYTSTTAVLWWFGSRPHNSGK